MGRIRELIDIFLRPSKGQENFDDILKEAGLDAEYAALLKSTREGLKWTGDEEEASVEKIRTKKLKTPSIEKEESDKGIHQKEKYRSDDEERQ